MAKVEFGTGGIRAVMGPEPGMMNRETVAFATQGLANYILKHASRDQYKACISFDSRNNSKEFASTTMRVLCANGIQVYLFDNIRPTPELSYAIRSTGSYAGVMITASHNPKEYNGYKVFGPDGAQVTSPADNEIVQEVAAITRMSDVKIDMESSPSVHSMGRDMDDKYLGDIISLTLSPESRARHADIKFVYTPLHGCGVRLVPETLKRLGFTKVYHVPEQDISDGNFPTVLSPNPEEASALKMAVARAEEVGADIVLATDPDADRMGIAVRDDNGRLVLFTGNQTASMLTYYMLNRWKELGKLDKNCYIVKTIVTTELMREIAESFGVKVYNVLTGFKYIAQVIREKEGTAETFICGAEESYGFNAGTFVRDKDAQMACAMLAECAAWAADKGMTLYQLMQRIYSEYGYRREGLASIVKAGPKGKEEIKSIIQNLRDNPPTELCGSPVVKAVDYLDSKATGMPKSNVLQFFSKAGDVVSVRPSGTEPKIKFYFGAKGPDADKRVEALKHQFTI